MMFLVVWFF